MTDTIAEDAIVNIVTGEVVEASETAEVARLWLEMHEAKQRLTDAMRAAQSVLEAEAARLGVSELHGVEVVVKNTYKWNMGALEQLKAAGLPEERWNEIVSYTPKVDARKLKPLGTRNPEYQSIIDGAYETETTRYVKRGK